MDSFTFNKIAGAVLATVLVGFVVVEVSHMLYPNPREGGHHGATGYAVPGMEAGHGNDHGTGEVVEEVDIATLLASADAAAGEAGFRACSSCHNAEPGAGAKVGPNLWGIVNRPMGSLAGFNYSRSMTAMGQNWTFENLNQFLESPSGFVGGTSMSYAGLRRDGQRANMIAYLATLADTPVALPTPGAAASHAEEAAHEVMEDAHDAVAEPAADMADTMDGAMDEAVEEAEMADDAAGEAMDDAQDTMDEAHDAMGDAMDDAQDAADEMPADGGDH